MPCTIESSGTDNWIELPRLLRPLFRVQFPSFLSKLTALVTLNMAGNYILDTIPPSISLLPSLTYLSGWLTAITVTTRRLESTSCGANSTTALDLTVLERNSVKLLRFRSEWHRVVRDNPRPTAAVELASTSLCRLLSTGPIRVHSHVPAHEWRAVGASTRRHSNQWHHSRRLPLWTCAQVSARIILSLLVACYCCCSYCGCGL